jgi:tetratricopeptide (TPR) repeat protein
MDVLRYGNQRQKQTLIPLIINNYHRNFAPVLKEAIKDEDNSIRVLASMGMAQIENQYMRRAIEIETKKRKANKSDKIYLKILGRHYDDYAHCEILDEIMQTDFRNLAIKSYEEYLHSNPLDGDVLFWLARAFLRNGKPEEAVIEFEVALKNKLLLPQNFIWYLESLYRLQKYGELRDVACEYIRHLNIAEGVIPPEVNKTLNIWSPCSDEL